MKNALDSAFFNLDLCRSVTNPVRRMGDSARVPQRKTLQQEVTMKMDFHTHGKLAKKLPFSEVYTNWLFAEAKRAGLDAMVVRY